MWSALSVNWLLDQIKIKQHHNESIPVFIEIVPNIKFTQIHSNTGLGFTFKSIKLKVMGFYQIK